MNSDFITRKDNIEKLTIESRTQESYQSEMHKLVGSTLEVPLADKEYRAFIPYTDENDIDFGAISANSTERNTVQVTEQKLSHNNVIMLVHHRTAKTQDFASKAEAIAKTVSVGAKTWTKMQLEGANGNTALLSEGNYQVMPLKKINNTQDLIGAIIAMKRVLGRNNTATDGFKIALSEDLEQFVAGFIPISETEKGAVYGILGALGEDFIYIPSFTNDDQMIIMTYAPALTMVYSTPPAPLGETVKDAGLLEEYTLTEIGFGSVSMLSSNFDKAVLVQPFITNPAELPKSYNMAMENFEGKEGQYKSISLKADDSAEITIIKAGEEVKQTGLWSQTEIGEITIILEVAPKITETITLTPNNNTFTAWIKYGDRKRFIKA